jgi:hypothetical protein
VTQSEIYINDNLESFGRVWVHVQNVDGKTCVPYRVRIAFDAVDFVIGLEDKDPSVSWDQYLREEVSELGSAGLSLYFLKLRKLSGTDDMEQPRWVIATLDAVIEDTHGLELQGRAVGFDSSRFLS